MVRDRKIAKFLGLHNEFFGKEKQCPHADPYHLPRQRRLRSSFVNNLVGSLNCIPFLIGSSMCPKRPDVSVSASPVDSTLEQWQTRRTRVHVIGECMTYTGWSAMKKDSWSA